MRNTYAEIWHDAVSQAEPASGNRDDLTRRLAEINAELKLRVGDFERICLCEERASIRKALAA